MPKTKSIVVVDTNILFSALLRTGSSMADVLIKCEEHFFICELVLVELFKRKEKIVRLSQLSEEDIVRFYYTLIRRVDIFKEQLISKEKWTKAYDLCKGIDETDTPHVALTLELNGQLWTGDKNLKDGLKRKGFDRFFEPH